jgi:hypothetical protein
MKQLFLILFSLFALLACDVKTQDPTYHDPVVTEHIKEPKAEAFKNPDDYVKARADYDKAVAAIREKSEAMSLHLESCLQGACNRVNKPNANVAPLTDAPAYAYKIDPNLPVSE